nr:glycoside hydrolase family 3 C-terminal domain-containing protein [Novosphingobium sp. P6W]
MRDAAKGLLAATALLATVAATATSAAADGPESSQSTLAATRPWMAAGLTPAARTELLLREMTLDEKIAMLHAPFAWPYKGTPVPEGAIGSAGYLPGNARLGIPPLQETDASLGVTNPFGFRMGQRLEIGATALPSGMALAATFDPTLAEKGGAMIAGEARDKGYNVLLAGGINLARDPRNGRNFEYMGEDPLLAGVMGGAQIRGVQSRNIVSTVKHFSLNGQETNRFWANSVIEEGAHRESDLLAFEIAIEQGKPVSVMCGYNLVNGHYACSNSHLLNKVLKQDWKYPGWVMSDWATTHGWQDALNGLDQQQAEQEDEQVWFGEPMRKAVADGKVPLARIDDMTRRILRGMFTAGLFDNPPVKRETDYDANALVAREVAQDGIVLLKNEGGALPLSVSTKRILVIGGHAEAGVLSGGGSSQVIAPGGKRSYVQIGGEGQNSAWRGMLFHQSAPLAAIRERAPAAEVIFYDGRYPGEAARLAGQADVVIVFATQWMTEGEDAPDISLPSGQDAVIAAAASANPNSIVVLETGGPVAMPWLGSVPAVLSAWYAGAKGGEAIADVLFGKVNPSGRLPVTFPVSLDQYPRLDTPGRDLPKKVQFDVPYVEGADVGYRRFSALGLKPLFPFGYGLSYTKFVYGDLALHGGRTITASFTVHNSGTRAGKDVPQLYLVDRAGIETNRLLGFEKVALEAGETREVTFNVDRRLLADFDVATNSWKVAGGRYRVAVGSSAQDYSLTGQARISRQSLAP